MILNRNCSKLTSIFCDDWDPLSLKLTAMLLDCEGTSGAVGPDTSNTDVVLNTC